ncbi:hypothetical protein ElyMa_002007100 [Elysia marginata]|uniref:Uncharacterized protein n=1 Tax=Elysia marginata TaxID=1093978 RepID=A0AAV4F423_9GAST|nr:hypothetical protein ElyMa_002007100 [Elysia marginata]
MLTPKDMQHYYHSHYSGSCGLIFRQWPRDEAATHDDDAKSQFANDKYNVKNYNNSSRSKNIPETDRCHQQGTSQSLPQFCCPLCPEKHALNIVWLIEGEGGGQRGELGVNTQLVVLPAGHRYSLTLTRQASAHIGSFRRFFRVKNTHEATSPILFPPLLAHTRTDNTFELKQKEDKKT